MTDRELLEAAAKAAGIALEWNDLGASGYWGVWRNLARWELWNPLTDDGDALRLAVKLRLHVDLHKSGVTAWVLSPDKAKPYDEYIEDESDPYAATRRAIARAAAAIGGAQP